MASRGLLRSGVAALLFVGGCDTLGQGPNLTELATGRVVLVNASLSDITAASVISCTGLVPMDRTAAAVLPGDRWITDLPGGCYRLVARAEAGRLVSKRFDLPPSGAYRIIVRPEG